MLNHWIKVLLRKIYRYIHLNLGSTSDVLQLAQIWYLRKAYLTHCLEVTLISKEAKGMGLSFKLEA
jgi:hypothetical protein